MVITNEIVLNRRRFSSTSEVQSLSQFSADRPKRTIFVEDWKILPRMSDIVWWSPIRKIGQGDVCGNEPTRIFVADFSGWHNFEAVKFIPTSFTGPGIVPAGRRIFGQIGLNQLESDSCHTTRSIRIYTGSRTIQSSGLRQFDP